MVQRTQERKKDQASRQTQAGFGRVGAAAGSGVIPGLVPVSQARGDSAEPGLPACRAAEDPRAAVPCEARLAIAWIRPASIALPVCVVPENDTFTFPGRFWAYSFFSCNTRDRTVLFTQKPSRSVMTMTYSVSKLDDHLSCERSNTSTAVLSHTIAPVLSHHVACAWRR